MRPSATQISYNLSGIDKEDKNSGKCECAEVKWTTCEDKLIMTEFEVSNNFAEISEVL